MLERKARKFQWRCQVFSSGEAGPGGGRYATKFGIKTTSRSLFPLFELYNARKGSRIDIDPFAKMIWKWDVSL